MQDISYKNDYGRFNLRVAGVILFNQKVLIMTNENLPYYYLPGGRVELHENSNEAICREIYEELNIKIPIPELMWINENFFNEEVSKEKFHEICFYFKIPLDNDCLITRQKDFVLMEDNRKNIFMWVNIEELNKYKVYPIFFTKELQNQKIGIRHIIEYKEC